MKWIELTVLKEVSDSMMNSVEKSFDELSRECEHRGPWSLAQWRACDHEDHLYHYHSYTMCKANDCPKLRR